MNSERSKFPQFPTGDISNIQTIIQVILALPTVESNYYIVVSLYVHGSYETIIKIIDL